jgi:hypothetical protein
VSAGIDFGNQVGVIVLGGIGPRARRLLLLKICLPLQNMLRLGPCSPLGRR